jgi:hypothetical protein
MMHIYQAGACWGYYQFLLEKEGVPSTQTGHRSLRFYIRHVTEAIPIYTGDYSLLPRELAFESIFV